MNFTPSEQTRPVIDIQNVFKAFQTVQAVKGIDLQIAEGEFTALLGPNGAGKTTLMEMIEGIQKPDRGNIRIMGKPWKGNENELHGLIGLSLQTTHFIDKLTVTETLRLFASFYQLGRNRVAEVIDLVGLSSKKKAYVASLSGGQQQRLALGIALLNRPRILLLDEPTTGLDPNARREIWSILLDLKHQAQTSLVLTTHYMEEAEQLCDTIVIIDHGEILKKGRLDALLENNRDRKIIEFAIGGDLPAHQVDTREWPFDIQWDVSGKKGVVVLQPMTTQLAVLLNLIDRQGLKLEDLTCRETTLDDLFTAMTGRHLHE